MRKIGRQSISIFALVLVVLLTGCAKTQDVSAKDKTNGNHEPGTYYSDSAKTNPEDDKRLESLFDDVVTEKTEVTEDAVSVVPEVTQSVTPNSSVGNTDVTDNIEYSDSLLGYVSDDTTSVDDQTFYYDELPDEFYDFEGPCILLDPENAHFEEIPNEDYDNQVNLVRDLVSLDEVDTPFSFFDDTHNKIDLATMYSNYVSHLEYLVTHTTPEEIVRELNNLFVLSQTPSCMPEEAWEFYFGALDKLKNHPHDAFYEVYIDLANFVNQMAIKNNVTLRLIQDN